MRTAKVLVMVMCVALAASTAIGAESVRSAKVLDLEGKVEVKNQAGAWMPADIDMVLNQGDMIRTQNDSFALLNVDGMAQTATVEVKENSELTLAELMEDRAEKTQSTLLDLAIGEILIKAKKLHSEQSRFEVKTPTSIVGVRGTTFSVSVEAEGE